jgi:AraC-like DNA-binding protein
MTEPLTNDQIFIRKLSEIIQANLQNENFGVTDLARESCMSLYKIGRKLYSIKNKRISQFIREVRLRKAVELLINGTFTASEVSIKSDSVVRPILINVPGVFGSTPGI